MSKADCATSQGWRDYWKADRPASCVAENPVTQQQIADTWRQWFVQRTDGSRILDVATGNGIVLAHAASAARETGRTFELTGIDLADIDPLRHVKDLDAGLRNAIFIGGASVEQLPFAARSFDVVVSQYGLEYAELQKALAEVERVLMPGGELRWLAHTQGSEVIQQHRDQALEVDFLLSPKGPVHFMNVFVARVRKHKDIRHSISVVNASLAEAEAFCFEHPPAKVVRQVCEGFAGVAARWQAYAVRDLETMMDAAEQRLLMHRLRIKSLLAAVLSPPRLAAVRGRLSGPHWTDCAISEMRVGSASSEIGILIEARRSTQG
jgi:SAM-dependent methyltransferase